MKKYIFHTLKLVATLGLACLAGNMQTVFAQPAPSSAATSTADANSLPPFITPSSPLAEVIRLVQADVETSVVLAYVSNSSGTFDLDSDKIIYLSDVGVPNEITTAMMQRDQALQQQLAAAPATQTPPPTSDANYTTEVTPPTDSGPVTVNYFYTSLEPYGSWVDIEGYGRCWRPTVAVYNSDWQPYCDRGHWVYTDSGWYWESDYAWGATFHYGRWFRDQRFGWCWWPDTEWAPSWVTWRYTDDYCGWAPLPPFAVWQPGIGFLYRGSGVSVGFDFGLDAGCFIFVPTGHFRDSHLRRFRCAPTEATRIYHHATVVNNFNHHDHVIVNNGIPPQHFRGTDGEPIHPVPVREVHVPPSFSQHPSRIIPQHQFGAPRTGNFPRQNFNREDHRDNNNGNNPQLNRNWTAPAQTPVRNNNEWRVNEPRNNQPPHTEAQTPQRFNQPAPETSHHYVPPVVNHSEPVERQRPSAPVDHTWPHSESESHQNHYEPPQHSAPAPQPSQSQQSSQRSQSSGRSSDWDQNRHNH